MAEPDERPIHPELARAVSRLLRAEQEYARAFGAWRDERDASARRPPVDLDEAERRIDAAQHEVIKWQAFERRAHADAERRP